MSEYMKRYLDSWTYQRSARVRSWRRVIESATWFRTDHWCCLASAVPIKICEECQATLAIFASDAGAADCVAVLDSMRKSWSELNDLVETCTKEPTPLNDDEFNIRYMQWCFSHNRTNPIRRPDLKLPVDWNNVRRGFN